MVRCVALWIVLMAPNIAWGQETEAVPGDILTLEQAVDIALTNNFSVKNAALEVQKAGDDATAARTKRLPTLDFTVQERRHLTSESYEFNAGTFGTLPLIGPIPAKKTTIRTAPQFTTVVTTSATLPLSQQYRIGLGIHQSEVNQALATEQLRGQRQQIADQVKQTYYKILQTQSMLAATEENIVSLRELDALVVRYVQEQTALQSESLQVKARLAKAEYDAFSQRNTMLSQKEYLNSLMGREIQTAVHVSLAPSPPSSGVDLASAQANALAQRPEIRAARLKVQQSEYDFRIKQAEYIPDVSLTAQYFSPFNIKLLPENVASVGIYARWEFFDWGRKRAELAAKGEAISEAKNEVRNTEDQIVMDVNNQVRSLQTADVLIGVAGQEQAAAREKLRETMDQYKQQATLLQNVLQAQASLAEANSNYQQAQLARWTAAANLTKALGEE